MAAQSNAAQTFVCALTGLSPLTDPVATPSGHVCSRKLLLQKLGENGGVDPFDASGARRLDESALIELSTSGGGGNAAPPRPPRATSLPALLGMLQHEFDAVLLELYDTRKALEETRRELSSALYQNDAAVRVVARLARERDEARGRLEEFLAGDGAPRAAAAAEPQKRGRDEEAAAAAKEGGTAKKAKVDSAPADLTQIPEADLAAMSQTWKALSKGRKSIAKGKRSAAETAANESLLAALAEGGEKKVNLGKSSAKAGVLCVTSVKAGGAEFVVTGGHDKTAIVYNVNEGKIVATLAGAGGDVTVVDALACEGCLLVAAGGADGSVRLHSVPLAGDAEPTLLGSAMLSDATPVDVVVHPSSTPDEARVLVATSGGSIELYKNAGGEELQLATHLESDGAFASGRIHPDGLIYIAGTTDGKLIVWDLKTQGVAGKLEGHDGNPVECIAVSENGYHVASSSKDSIHAWDLRKLKLMTRFAPADVGAVTALAFDPSATYLAYAGEEATKVCVAKDWERVVCTLAPGKRGKKKAGATGGGVAWGGEGFGKEGAEGKVWLATGCDGERPVRFWGVA
ncbi:hypothetical protein ACHAXT_013267 [Thalassiosira profunda]